MKFTLRQLEVFTAVARHESVSRAAQELAMSQSAASTALGELERIHARPLFDRVGKSLRLNEVGTLLLPATVELLDHAAEIENVLEGRSGFGTLQIGATLTVGPDLKITDKLGRRAGIVKTDIMASNGVIHVIDKVILPRGL